MMEAQLIMMQVSLIQLPICNKRSALQFINIILVVCRCGIFYRPVFLAIWSIEKNNPIAPFISNHFSTTAGELI